MVSTPVNRSGYLLAVVNLQWLTQGLSGGAMPTIGPDAVELAKALPTAPPQCRPVPCESIQGGEWSTAAFSIERFRRSATFQSNGFGTMTLDSLSVTRPRCAPAFAMRRESHRPRPVRTGNDAVSCRKWGVAPFSGREGVGGGGEASRLQRVGIGGGNAASLALGMQTEDGQGRFGKTLDWIQPVSEPEEREWITAAILAVSDRLLTIAETYSRAKEWSAMPNIPRFAPPYIGDNHWF